MAAHFFTVSEGNYNIFSGDRFYTTTDLNAGVAANML